MFFSLVVVDGWRFILEDHSYREFPIIVVSEGALINLNPVHAGMSMESRPCPVGYLLEPGQTKRDKDRQAE
jgi:hypothetical protein